MVDTFDIFNSIEPSDLGFDAKWNVLRGFVEISVTEGLSGNASEGLARDFGFQFASDRYRELYREISGYRADFTYQTRIGADLHPNPDLMAKSKYALEADYGYVGQFFFVDEKTGLLTPKTFRVDSDSLLTRNEALDMLEDKFTRYPPVLLDKIIGQIEFVGSMVNLEI